MICECKSCHRPFWRYRRDFPPAGFCSLPCREVGPTKEPSKDGPPPLPEVVLHEMRHHRFHYHGTTSILGWFHDCERCGELESDYAVSLEYHYNAASAEIAELARARWANKQSQEGIRC